VNHSSDSVSGPLSPEKADLLGTLGTARFFLKNTLRGLSDEQAALSPTASELCLGGLIKHVTLVEQGWAGFVQRGPEALSRNGRNFSEWTPEDFAARQEEFSFGEGETVADVLAAYDAVAAATDSLLRELDSLDVAHPLPPAPWYEEGQSWTARRAFMHIVAETTQHAGHADILRETIDGAKSMG
jgi:uncharacterized damage-inducible protein DinB